MVHDLDCSKISCSLNRLSDSGALFSLGSRFVERIGKQPDRPCLLNSVFCQWFHLSRQTDWHVVCTSNVPTRITPRWRPPVWPWPERKPVRAFFRGLYRPERLRTSQRSVIRRSRVQPPPSPHGSVKPSLPKARASFWSLLGAERMSALAEYPIAYGKKLDRAVSSVDRMW
jgi:hypothetical protein